MNDKNSKIIKYDVKIFLRIAGIAIFAFLIVKVKADNFLSVFKNIPFTYLASIIILIINCYFLIAYRLKRMILTHLNYIKILDIWIKSILLGYISGLRGAAFGAKVALLKLKGNKVSSSLAGVSAELLYDTLFTFIVMVIFLIKNHSLFLQKLPHTLDTRIITLSLTAIFLFLLIYLCYKKYFFVKEYIGKISRSFNRANSLTNIALTLIIWTGNAIIMFLFFRALGHKIDPWMSLAAVCTGSIAGFLSFSPGGLGIYELISSYILSLSGIPFDSALSITILMRLIGIIVAVSILIFINIFFAKKLKGATGVI